MRRFFLNLLFCLFAYLFIFYPVLAQSPTQGPRFAQCDACGYCPSINPTPPQSWTSCQKCLYPNINPNPAAMGSLVVDPNTNEPIAPAPGKMYTFLGCLGTGNSFTESGSSGSVVQSILNIVFSISGGIALLYLIYGSFTIATSQADPERLNYGKRVVTGAIIGLVFALSSVLIVNFIASNVLKVPEFGNPP